jgi:hypothetical protein
MATVKKANITKEQMLADGWKEMDDEVFILEKEIENRNPLNNDPEDTDIKLVVHGMYNCWTFAVLFPSGAMLNFVANSMKDLNKFESMLNFYDCEY